MKETVVAGSDADEYVKHVQKCVNAGFDHVYIHHLGQDQAEFMEFVQRKSLPAFA